MAKYIGHKLPDMVRERSACRCAHFLFIIDSVGIVVTMDVMDGERIIGK